MFTLVWYAEKNAVALRWTEPSLLWILELARLLLLLLGLVGESRFHCHYSRTRKLDLLAYDLYDDIFVHANLVSSTWISCGAWP